MNGGWPACKSRLRWRPAHAACTSQTQPTDTCTCINHAPHISQHDSRSASTQRTQKQHYPYFIFTNVYIYTHWHTHAKTVTRGSACYAWRCRRSPCNVVLRTCAAGFGVNVPTNGRDRSRSESCSRKKSLLLAARSCQTRLVFRTTSSRALSRETMKCLHNIVHILSWHI